jgi:hypothetical protein
MATTTRRYRWAGPDLSRLRAIGDPGAVLAQTAYASFVDVSFDDAIVDPAAVDAQMQDDGFVFDAVAGAEPFFAFRSPDGALQRVQIANVEGVLLTPRSYINGLGLGFRSLHEVTIEAGIARANRDSFSILVAAPLTVDIVLSGAGGLDVGVEAADTWYFVYVIGDSTGVNPAVGLLSLSSVAPTLPPGYDRFRRVGTVRNNGTSDFVDFVQQAAADLRSYHYLALLDGRQILVAGAAIVRTNVSAASFVPPTSRFGRFQCRTNGTSGANFFAGTAGRVIRSLPVLTQFNDVVPLDATQQIAYQNAIAGGATDIWVTGFDEVV